MSSPRYPEKSIQQAMTSWLCDRWAFQSIFDDVEALGARFDSIGLMDDRLVLIEYKVGVSEAIVRHAPDKPMSLESKIAGGLRALYSRGGDAASVVANEVWDRSSPPLVVVAAERFAESAVSALEGLFRDRSPEWNFDWAAWRWTGAGVEELLRGQADTSPNLHDYAGLDVPHLIGRSARSAPRSLHELIDLASADEGRLLKEFADAALSIGYRFRFGRTKLAILGERAGNRVIVAAAYVGASPSGLNVGVDLAHAAHPKVLGALDTAKPAGFLNTNVQITSSDDLGLLFELIGRGSGTP